MSGALNGPRGAELEALPPEERERVMAVARLRGALVLEFLEVRLFMLVEMSAGASREEAYERLLAAGREHGRHE